jgi:hypothetical protein
MIEVLDKTYANLQKTLTEHSRRGQLFTGIDRLGAVPENQKRLFTELFEELNVGSLEHTETKSPVANPDITWLQTAHTGNLFLVSPPGVGERLIRERRTRL